MSAVVIPLLAAAIAGLAALAVIAILTYEAVVSWFVQRRSMKLAQDSNIAFTLVDKLGNGNYKTVQGIFDTASARLIDGKATESRALDSDLANIHGSERLVVYN